MTHMRPDKDIGFMVPFGLLGIIFGAALYYGPKPTRKGCRVMLSTGRSLCFSMYGSEFRVQYRGL